MNTFKTDWYFLHNKSKNKKLSGNWSRECANDLQWFDRFFEILFKKSKLGLMTFYIVPNDYIFIIWYIFDLIGCALGAQWAVDSAQWAVFLTFLFVKLGSYNFVCSLEFGFHKHFCKLFLRILITNGVHWVHSGLFF